MNFDPKYDSSTRYYDVIDKKKIQKIYEIVQTYNFIKKIAKYNFTVVNNAENLQN